MNVFELSSAIAIVGGGVIGGEKGYAIRGGLGAVIGAMVGAGAGLAVALTATFLVAALLSAVTKKPLFKPKPPRRA